MDVGRTRGNERMLRRVIALLVAFAVLAERVTDRSLAVRFFVLWILRRAETVAAAYTFEEVGIARWAIEGLEGIAVAGHGPQDARRLAARFQALAAALRTRLPIACPFADRPPLRGFILDHMGPGRGRRAGRWTPTPYDTS